MANSDTLVSRVVSVQQQLTALLSHVMIPLWRPLHSCRQPLTTSWSGTLCLPTSSWLEKAEAPAWDAHAVSLTGCSWRYSSTTWWPLGRYLRGAALASLASCWTPVSPGLMLAPLFYQCTRTSHYFWCCAGIAGLVSCLRGRVAPHDSSLRAPAPLDMQACKGQAQLLRAALCYVGLS